MEETAGSGYPEALSWAFERRLGRALVDLGFVTRSQLEEAERCSLERQVSLPTSLDTLRYLPRLTVLALAHFALGIPTTNLDTTEVDVEVLELVPREVALRYEALPVRIERTGELRIAMRDPCNPETVRELERASGRRIKQTLAVVEDMAETIDRAYGQLTLRHQVNEIIGKALSTFGGDEPSGGGAHRQQPRRERPEPPSPPPVQGDLEASYPVPEDLDEEVDPTTQEDRAIRLYVIGLISMEQLKRQLAMVWQDRVRRQAQESI